MDRKLMFAILELLFARKQLTRKELLATTKATKGKLDEVIKALDGQLLENGAYIDYDSVRKEYRLQVTDYGAFEQYYRQAGYRESLEGDRNDRINSILISLLTQDGYVKIEELAESLFVSPRQISKDLKEVREYLGRFHIRLISTPYYGLEVKGTEFDRRMCIADWYSRTEGERELYAKNWEEPERTDLIRKTVSETLKKYDFSIGDTAFDNLIIHLHVSLMRIQTGHGVDRDYTELVRPSEMRISREILSRLCRKLGIDYSENEAAYIALHLTGKRTYGEGYSENIPPEVGDLVIEMLERIDRKYGTRLRSDFELCMMLSLHCMPLLSRIKYSLNQKNPLLDEIRSRFIYEFELAQEGCRVLEEKFHCQISEDEIGYIALLIRAAMEKQRKNEKYDILLVCSTGRGSAELLRLKFKESFGAYIGRLVLCSARKAQSMDLDCFDYIFTTVPLFLRTNTPILQINLFLGSTDIQKIGGIFQTAELGKKRERYFPPELFMGLKEFADKEDAIRKMTAHIAEYRELPEHFFQSVMERERMANTSFGGSVAFPHPKELLTSETFACVAVAKHPIPWGRGKVRLILLASIEYGKDKNLQDFYKMIARIVNDSEKADALIRSPHYETLVRLLENPS